MMHNTIRFILAGKIEEISHFEPDLTVLEYLRETRKLTGTKEGCAEGDCGACTVVLGELSGDSIRYRAVNACIQFVASLDGKLLLTVEDLAHSNGTLHPVQQALVDEHGSQCGFCTPGFVMSLFSMSCNRHERAPSRPEIQLGLAGNLCRCTGYAPIIRAAEKVLSSTENDDFTKNQQAIIDLLRTIQSTTSLRIIHGDRHFSAPRSSEELSELLEQQPDAVMIAGATDVGLWVTKQLRRLDSIIYLARVPQLQGLTRDEDYLRIGAAVSYTDALDALGECYPAFVPLVHRIGAMQVRNVGTIGGNIANGSPIGDMPPGLIALGTRLLLNSTHGRRMIDLEDFFISYGEQDLRPGEFIEQVLLPLPSKQQVFATYKLSKRLEQDISAVCAAFSMHIENGLIRDARICFGGMAETPKRAPACEQALNNKHWTRTSINQAMQAIRNDFTPLSDMRATAGYRMQTAQHLLLRFFLENCDTPYPVQLSQKYAEHSDDR